MNNKQNNREVEKCEDIFEELYNFSPNNDEICLADYVITSDLLSQLFESFDTKDQELTQAREENIRLRKVLEEIEDHRVCEIGYEDKEDIILQMTYKFTNGCQQALGGNK